MPTKNSSHLSHISITEENVYNTLINLCMSKAMGLDGIPPIVLSKLVSVQYRSFQYLFSLTLKYGYLPMDWKIHKMIPVFKSRVPIQLKNYWPFPLLCNISKVLKRMVYYNKPINHAYCQINPAQLGFMQKFTTIQLLMFWSNSFTIHHQLDTQGLW